MELNAKKVSTGIILYMIIVSLGLGCAAITVPEIDDISLTDGAVFVTRDVEIEWMGIHHHLTDGHWIRSTDLMYHYQLDNSPWVITDDTSVTLTNLSEGFHTLFLKAQYGTEMPGLPIVRTFTIDTIKGPGIVFSPRKVTDKSEIVINFEDVALIMSAHIEIVCENGCASLDSFTKKEITGAEGEYIAISDITNPSRLIVDIAFAGYTGGINGSPEFGVLSVLPVQSGKISVDYSKTRFRDINNTDITIDPGSFDWVNVEK